jgi:4'-phosphopantetheinyl transferase
MVDGAGRPRDLLPSPRRPYHQPVIVVESAASRGQFIAPSPEPRAAIGATELHVWRASLERAPAEVARLRRLLGADERGRADRFRFDRDRSRYTVGRGILRILLGRYLGLPAQRVAFRYGRFGKPVLADHPLWFNVSHSGPVALFAFTPLGEVGIDVELDAADFSREPIAERFFSPAEVSALRALAPRLQPLAFLTCWTRKEAFIKARGDGLSLALDSFDVNLEPGSAAAVLRTAWSDDEPGQWSLHDLSDPDEGFVATVAVRSDGWRLVNRRLESLDDYSSRGQETT